jgi:ADP-ribose pyrophosphatase
MEDKHWEVLARHELLDCSPWVKVYSETVQLEDKKTIVPDFYRIDLPDFVVIFAVTVDDNVAVVEQYRHGVGAVTLELPSGIIDPGEAPLTTAKRELREEAGLAAPHWEAMASFTVAPNRGCGKGYAFLAHDAEPVGEPDGGELQQQSAHLKSISWLREFWASGQCANMSSVAVIGLGLSRIGHL